MDDKLMKMLADLECAMIARLPKEERELRIREMEAAALEKMQSLEPADRLEMTRSAVEFVIQEPVVAFLCARQDCIQNAINTGMLSESEATSLVDSIVVELTAVSVEPLKRRLEQQNERR
jgi:hypothetical protein